MLGANAHLDIILPSVSRFFWSSVSAAESNFVSVHSHMLACKYIPDELKQQLAGLKALRREQTSRLKTGSQKAFFTRVWARLHGETAAAPPPPGFRLRAKAKAKASEVLHRGTVACVVAPPAKGEAGEEKGPPPSTLDDGPLALLNMSQSHDSHELRALLECKSTLSSMPSIDMEAMVLKHAGTYGMEDVLETEELCDAAAGGGIHGSGRGGGSTSGGSGSSGGGNALDGDLTTGQSSESYAEQESKSSLASMALNLSAVSVHCKEDQRPSNVEKV